MRSLCSLCIGSGWTPLNIGTSRETTCHVRRVIIITNIRKTTKYFYQDGLINWIDDRDIPTLTVFVSLKIESPVFQMSLLVSFHMDRKANPGFALSSANGLGVSITPASSWSWSCTFFRCLPFSTAASDCLKNFYLTAAIQCEKQQELPTSGYRLQQISGWLSSCL